MTARAEAAGFYELRHGEFPRPCPAAFQWFPSA